MAEETPATQPAMVGCNFDAATAEATAGKDVLLCITDPNTADLLALQGQQGLSFNVSIETNETKTKNTGGWVSKTPGAKSWDASCDGLYSTDDKARREIVKSIVDSRLVCVGMYTREQNGNDITYTPVRKGMAIATSDNLDAPQDEDRKSVV